MKRALLIAGGTVGGLGAVLAITPPQLSSGDLNIAGGAVTSSTGTDMSASASSSSSMASGTTVATKSAKPVATKKSTSGATAAATSAATVAPTKSSTPTVAATKSSTPTVAPTTAAAKSGTFTGPAVFVNYGTVQVQITVVNGKITDAVALQAPTGKNDRYTRMAVPILKQQTLAAQSANIQGASGASYTSFGWHKSLQGALADAGL
jgi:uncharacterized protein with FMN-binding domain